MAIFHETEEPVFYDVEIRLQSATCNRIYIDRYISIELLYLKLLDQMSTPHADKHFWHTSKRIIYNYKFSFFQQYKKGIGLTYDLDEHLQVRLEGVEEWIEGNIASAPWHKRFYTASKVLSVMF